MQYSAVERNKKPIGSLDIPDDFDKFYLRKKDRQMRFCNAKDPIYHVFSSIDKRPLGELFRGFVKESIKDTQKFLYKLVA
ncbi:MAG: hypothetical protein K6E29_09735 [Cyanobacteria bacterium RUI128]|nr:hypothetical protein [Cyanobacteria bacterium RUI128]